LTRIGGGERDREQSERGKNGNRKKKSDQKVCGHADGPEKKKDILTNNYRAAMQSTIPGAPNHHRVTYKKFREGVRIASQIPSDES